MYMNMYLHASTHVCVYIYIYMCVCTYMSTMYMYIYTMCVSTFFRMVRGTRRTLNKPSESGDLRGPVRGVFLVLFVPSTVNGSWNLTQRLNEAFWYILRPQRHVIVNP